MAIGNLFADIPETLMEELFGEILRIGNVRIERIVSRGQSSPPDFWYDQQEDEWILLLKGSATLRFFDGREIALNPGDHLLIPGHERHRVVRTDPAGETIWLAVHFKLEKPYVKGDLTGVTT
jgi:cupin 2 domain-containing protein